MFLAPDATPRDLVIWYARRFIGLPYIWGGDDPIIGFDCSGLVVECLQAAGILRRGSDFTAQGLADFSERVHVENRRPGDLIFWTREGGSIRHVGILIANNYVLHAGGGDSDTSDAQAAARKNAFVKIDHVDYAGEYCVGNPY